MLTLFLETLNIQHEGGVVEDLPNEISHEELDNAITTLLEQNEMARKKIKDMIDRLRSLSAE